MRAKTRPDPEAPQELQLLCTDCKNQWQCQQLCRPGEFLADGNIKLKELLFKFDTPFRESSNYNDVLYQLSKEKEKTINLIHKVRILEDQRIKLIAAALHADISIESLSSIMESMPKSTAGIYKLLNRHIKTFQ